MRFLSDNGDLPDIPGKVILQTNICRWAAAELTHGTMLGENSRPDYLGTFHDAGARLPNAEEFNAMSLDIKVEDLLHEADKSGKRQAEDQKNFNEHKASGAGSKGRGSTNIFGQTALRIKNQ